MRLFKIPAINGIEHHRRACYLGLKIEKVAKIVQNLTILYVPTNGKTRFYLKKITQCKNSWNS